MTYDPAAYWEARGARYQRRFHHARYVAQEEALAQLLGELDFTSVLDVGCGFGRIGRRIIAERPDVRYTGIDLSYRQVRSAQRSIPAGRFTVTSLADFEPTERYDLVLAIEVLMHIPPSEVRAAVRKLEQLTTRHLVTVDWTEPIPVAAAEHNFRHDYAALFGRRKVERSPVGLQTIHRVTKR